MLPVCLEFPLGTVLVTFPVTVTKYHDKGLVSTQSPGSSPSQSPGEVTAAEV